MTAEPPPAPPLKTNLTWTTLFSRNRRTTGTRWSLQRLLQLNCMSIRSRRCVSWCRGRMPWRWARGSWLGRGCCIPPGSCIICPMGIQFNYYCNYCIIKYIYTLLTLLVLLILMIVTCFSTPQADRLPFFCLNLAVSVAGGSWLTTWASARPSWWSPWYTPTSPDKTRRRNSNSRINSRMPGETSRLVYHRRRQELW